MRRAKRGADGVARSARPIGRSFNRSPAELFRRTDHPGAPARWLSRHPSSARRGMFAMFRTITSRHPADGTQYIRPGSCRR